MMVIGIVSGEPGVPSLWHCHGTAFSNICGTGLIFLSTTRNEELTNGLIRMGCPYPIAFALSTALRLVPTFAGAGATIIQAQVSRGLDLESGNIFSRVG